MRSARRADAAGGGTASSHDPPRDHTTAASILSSHRVGTVTVDERGFQTIHRPIDSFDVVAAALELKGRQTNLLRAELLRGNSALVCTSGILEESIDLLAVVALREETNLGTQSSLLLIL